MKCNDIKLLLMDFLYDEISDEDKKIVKNHLSHCTVCQKELKSLKQTSTTLQQWEDVDPKLNLVFVSEIKSTWSIIKEKLSVSHKKFAYGFAIGFALILIFLSFANTEISYNNGNFSLKMSIMPRKTEQQNDTMNNELIAQLQQQNIQLMNKLIQHSEDRQRQQIMNTLAQFYHDLENRRATELRLVGAGLDEIEKNIYSKLERRTNNQFSNLIRYIDAKQGIK